MNPQNFPEAKLAWVIWQALEKLNNLLWDRYQKDFLSLAMEKEDHHFESTPSDMEEDDHDCESTISDMEQINGPPPEDSASSET